MTNNPKTGINGGYKAILNPTDLDSEIDAILRKAIDGNQYYDGDTGYMPITALDEAKAQLQAIIAKECDKARIDELEKMQAMNGWHEGDWKQSMLDRIAQLKAEAVERGEDRE